MKKSVFIVERTEKGFRYTRGPVSGLSVTPITRHLGNRTPAQAALEEGKAWLQETANVGSSQVEVTIEW
jgi:hypothetical protein